MHEPAEGGDRVRGLLRELSRSGTAVGDLTREGTAELLPLVYDELKRIAGREMGRERADHTLQPTALVHEAWLRLCGDSQAEWSERGHFLAAAAIAMRRILVEHARARGGPRRGGDRARLSLGEDAALGEAGALSGPRAVELLDLDVALDRLEQRDPRKARVVHLRTFAGLTMEEIAAALGLSLATVKADWAFARAWLFRELEGER